MGILPASLSMELKEKQPAVFTPDLKDWAVALFDELRRMSFDGVGISRATYGEGESRAMAIIAAAAEREGLGVAYDAAANLVITLPGQRPELPFAACGSHLDSVPQGGNFDGAAGVIAGLMGLVHLKRADIVPPRTLKVYALRGEESAWFGKCYLGSMALFGRFDPNDFELRQGSTGQSLGDCMAASGADVERLRRGEVLVRPDEMACFVELHIEQGPVMVAKEIPVGIVTGIRGNIRHPKAVCRGEAAHSGAVPRWLRHDAVFAISDLVMRLDRTWQALLEQGQDLVVTLGILGTNPSEHAMSRVPGEVRFSLEYRSQSTEVLAGFGDLVAEEAAAIGRARGVAFDFGTAVPTPPAVMDARLVAHLSRVCEAQRIPYETLPSGAGHDSAIFANAGVPTTMIFIRNEHGSHNPREAMDFADFFLGAEVLIGGLIGAPEALA